MPAVTRLRPDGGWLLTLVPLLAAAMLACEDNEEPTGPNLPASFTIAVETNVDTVWVSWAALANVDSFLVELRTNPDTLSQSVAGDDTLAVFTGEDGVEDGQDYTAIVFAVNAAGSTESGNTETVAVSYFPWDENYYTSLHAEAQGMAYFYDDANGGFEQFTGIPYLDLTCKGCHLPEFTGACQSCHDVAEPGLGAQVDGRLDGVCGPCHSRQTAERDRGFSDYHRDVLEYWCTDCHGKGDIMGDGTEYNSMLAEGGIDAKCENCHAPHSEPHDGRLDCSACHVQSVVTCYNCHFESEVYLGQKIARRQIFNWMFLVNRNDKVYPANVMTLKWGPNDQMPDDSSTFAVFAPFYAHTVGEARECSDCHDNENIRDLDEDGVLVITQFDGEDNVIPLSGVIPVPFNYQTALFFDFLDRDMASGTWSFLERGPDVWQMLFAEPLTADQMEALRTPIGG
jgi:hypothetical protein